MKTLHLTLAKELLIVEVPENSELTAIGNNENVYYAIKHDGEEKYTKVANGKDYKLRCKGSDLTEEIAKEYVKGFQFGTKENPHLRWLDYKSDYYHKLTALESFKSAIEANGYCFGFYSSLAAYKGKFDNWEEAESRTFNLSNTLIFEKI